MPLTDFRQWHFPRLASLWRISKQTDSWGLTVGLRNWPVDEIIGQ